MLLFLLPMIASSLVPARQLPSLSRSSSSAPPVMLISAEAMITIQKTFNRAGFEQTVEDYARVKKVTKEEAELEYANYLLDPDAYVLAKASDSFKNPSLRGSRGADKKPLNVKKAKMGDRRSPLLQAYIDEGGDDVKERIEKFERNNQIKALTIITLFSALLIFGKDYV